MAALLWIRLMLRLLYEQRKAEELGRGVAHEFYCSMSRDRRVVSTGTRVILKPSNLTQNYQNCAGYLCCSGT